MRCDKNVRRKATDAGADDDEVIAFIKIKRLGQRSPIPQRVCILKGTRMAAPHAGQARRVITSAILGPNR